MHGNVVFTPNMAGCYADGTFGHDHVRIVLLDLLVQARGPARDPFVLASLEYPEMPDDAWDEIAAIDWINTHACEDCHFLMEAGDLILFPDPMEG